MNKEIECPELEKIISKTRKTVTRLSNKQVLDIKQKSKSGISYAQLGREYNYSKAGIRFICLDKARLHGEEYVSARRIPQSPSFNNN